MASCDRYFSPRRLASAGVGGALAGCGSAALDEGGPGLAVAEKASAGAGSTGDTDGRESFDWSKEERPASVEERAVEVASGLAGRDRANAWTLRGSRSDSERPNSVPLT